MAQEFTAAKHARAEQHAKGSNQRFPGKAYAGNRCLNAAEDHATKTRNGREITRRFHGHWRGGECRAVPFQDRDHIG